MQICGICGGNHCPMECDIVQVTSHIPDNTIPSKAKLTLPEDLELRKMADDTYSVIASFPIAKGTQFGPLQAKKLCSLLPTISFPLRVFYKTEDNFSEYYLDTSDENECNWMIFVNPASDFQEQNIISYQDGEDIYYVTIKDLCEGEALKVWYSPYYATKMQKDVLKPIVSEQTKTLQYNDCLDTLVRNKKNITPREIWSCKFCGKMERNLSEFTLHLLQHYRTKLKRYCQICNVSFIKVQGYQKHMKIVHETDPTKKVAVQLESKSNSIQKTEKRVPETPDDNYFGGPLLLNDLLSDSMDNTTLVLPHTYMNQMDLTGIEHQNTLFENENLNLNMESILPENGKSLDNFNFEIAENENEQFVCDICLKAFRKLKAMMVHMNIHSGKFTCFDCNKVFARRENLDHHPCKLFYRFKCPHCAKLFYQKKYLMRHIKISHTNKNNSTSKSDSKETSFTCTECFRTFTKKYNLMTHLKSHQKGCEKYTCPVCNKVLNSQKTYFKHYKLHEGIAFKCDICEKTFKRKDNLKYHKDHTHSPNVEVCSICSKVVKTKKLLKMHMKLHEDNFHRCSQCPSFFKLKHNLNRHMRTSHGTNKGIQSFLSNIDKQYSCPKCDKKLKLRRSVKRHLESAHPEFNAEYKTLRLNKSDNKKLNISKQVEDSVLDLKQTIENMNFNTDEINNEITIEIDKLLNNPENFGSESNDRLVESLINTAVRENNLETKNQQKDSMLSMPDLDLDRDL